MSVLDGFLLLKCSDPESRHPLSVTSATITTATSNDNNSNNNSSNNSNNNKKQKVTEVAVDMKII